MAKITISYDQRESVIWSDLFTHFDSEISEFCNAMRELNQVLDEDVDKMDYKTGSITEASCLCLYLITRHLKPSTVFEVGTYVGRSCGAMALAMDSNGANINKIYTCDISNEFAMDTSRFRTQFIAMPKTSSTDALSRLQSKDCKVDLFHIDGLIQEEDLPVMASLSHQGTAIALDDFLIDDKVRKGVQNMMAIKSIEPFNTYFLVFPAKDSLTASIGIRDVSRTALLLSPSRYEALV